jgi:hypothetical protein
MKTKNGDRRKFKNGDRRKFRQKFGNLLECCRGKCIHVTDFSRRLNYFTNLTVTEIIFPISVTRNYISNFVNYYSDTKRRNNSSKKELTSDIFNLLFHHCRESAMNHKKEKAGMGKEKEKL